MRGPQTEGRALPIGSPIILLVHDRRSSAMPNPWKKPRPGGGRGGGVSRFLAGIRPHRGVSLVVQTGFPTSLADLFVKNRGRLRKPSRKKKPPSESDSAASEPPPVTSPLDGGPLPEASSVGRPIPVAADGFPSLPDSIGMKHRRLGIVFGLLLIMTLVLVVLAIERKMLVAGFTLSALALWLLDSIGYRALWFSKPCSDATTRLNSVVGGWEFEGRGVVSPIREGGIDSCSDTVRSESSSLESTDCEQGTEVLLEQCDLAWTGKISLVRDLSSKGNSKAKKLFRKLIPKKHRAQKHGNDEKELSLDLSGRGSITEIEEEDPKAINRDDEAVLSVRDVLSMNASDSVTDHDKQDVEFIRENGHGIRSRSSQKLVFCAVVLLGLLGGKIVALVLTVSWFLFSKSIKSLLK
ncbi:hypothetical protein BHE74_00021370 [Ensete ventricosum]|nr:hypothetical protein BHE74_00021370 [Ensete ventricosum]